MTLRFLGLLSLAALLVSAALLYLASAPVAGAIQFVGANKTEDEIKAADRRRRIQRAVGFVLLGLGTIVQAVVVWLTPYSRSGPRRGDSAASG